MMRKAAAGHPSAGSSIIEMVIVVAVLVGLAAVIVPAAHDGADNVDEVRALDDCNLISTALVQYASDTRHKACGFQGRDSYGWLRGPGTQPGFAANIEGGVGELDWFLVKNEMGGGNRWTGPYMDNVPIDPWGHQYIVLTAGWWKSAAGRGADNVWVLSAGPDGVIQTTCESIQIVGDDIGVSLEQ